MYAYANDLHAQNDTPIQIKITFADKNRIYDYPTTTIMMCVMRQKSMD